MLFHLVVLGVSNESICCPIHLSFWTNLVCTCYPALMRLSFFPMPQGLSNIAWAYAKLDAQLTPEVVQLLEALAVEAASQLMDASCRQKFIPQNLSNMLYGYAVLGYHPGPSLLVSIAKEALRQLREFGPQELTNMVSGCDFVLVLTAFSKPVLSISKFYCAQRRQESFFNLL